MSTFIQTLLQMLTHLVILFIKSITGVSKIKQNEQKASGALQLLPAYHSHSSINLLHMEKHLQRRGQVRKIFTAITWLFAGLFLTFTATAQTTIVSDGLNNVAGHLSLTGGAYFNGTSTAGESPASSSYFIEGTHARGVTNGTATLTSGSNINTSAYTNIQMSLRLAAFSITNNTNGMENTDDVTVEISTNGGTNYTTYLTVTGASAGNARWAYAATGVATAAYPTPATFAPAGTGLRTTDGYSTLTITSLPATTQLRVRITLTNSSTSERWVVDDFKITGCQPANAGTDQTNCNSGNFTLAGNTATAGSGAWSVVSGTATITTPSSATSTVTGVPVGTSATLRWTITNGTCSTTDDIILTNNDNPTTANAGADRTDNTTCGLTTIALAANTPTVGTGAWSIVSGTGGSFSNAASPTSNFTGTAGNTYTLRWTISNSPCTASTDDVIVTFNRNPTTANAGTDKNNCNSGNFTMTGNTPTIGTGSWSVVSGTANITTPSSATSGITGVPAGTSATLRWTISNSPCTASFDDVILTNYDLATVSAAGPDQANCNSGSFTLAGNTPTIGTGAWSVVSGTATITTPSSPTSGVTGIAAGASATLRWTITNGSCTSTDDVLLTNNALPTTANASTDQTLCNAASFTLNGNNPTTGTGLWSLVSGTATITTPSLRNTTVTGIPAGTSATLRWSITNGVCPSSTDDVVLTSSAVPTTAAAGADQANCNSGSFTLAGNTPSVGTGLWTVTSGTATITTNTSPTSGVTAIAAGASATLTWTITNGACTSSDAVILSNNALPSTANAGADQTNCNSGSFTMAATAPTTGTGAWSLVSGTANITTPSSRTSGITGVPAGTSATLRWTVSNGVCTATTDDVILTNRSASTVPNAGADQTNCNNGSFTLAGNTITSGVGSWSVISGTATITTPSSPTSTVTGVPAGTSATLRWTVTNSPCATLTDDVILTNNAKPTTVATAICQGGSSALTSSYTCPAAAQTSSGPNNATSGANVNGPGTGGSWSNTGNLNAAGSATATVAISGTSEYLQGSAYGFSIPAGATINGITVSINRSSSSNAGGNSLNDADLNLLKAGSIVGTDKASATDWPTTLGIATYGSSSDLWGTTWTASDINDPGFGVSLSALNQSAAGTRTASVDYMQVTVTYTPAGSLNWYTQSSGGTIVHTGSPFNPVGDAQVIAQGAPYSNLTNSNTPGTYTFYAECSTVPGCRTATDFVINSLPAVTLGTSPSVLRSTTTANISYNVINGAPDEYSIDYNAAAEAQGFVDVVNAPLPASPISLVIPATANAGTYNANLTVRSSGAPSCPSSAAAFTVTVQQVNLTINGVTANDKIYDGNNTATLSGTAAYAGLVNGESFAVLGTPVATFNNKHFGTAKPVTVTGYLAPNANYTITQPSFTANIDKRDFTVTAVTDLKFYDGSNSSANAPTYPAVQSGDAVSVAPTQTFDNKNAGANKTISASGLVINDGNSGNNYNIIYADDNTGEIVPLTITPSLSGSISKPYDGNNSISTGSLTINLPGVIAPDVVTASAVAAAYDNENVAGSPNKQVTVSGISLSGADAGNYDLSTNTISVNTGIITALNIVVTPDAGQFKVVGGSDPVFTYSISPSLIAPDVLTGNIGRNSGEAIGTYAFTLNTLSAGSNYSLSLNNANTFEIQAVSQSNADFRTRSNGNFSAASTWEYNPGDGNWTNASQAPTSANNIEVLHDLTVNQDFSVGNSKTFVINNSGTMTVNSDRTFSIGVNGSANFNGKSVTFKSANNGTAALGQVLGTLSGATNVTVERYIPNNGFRSWRLLSVPTFGNGQTIRQAWQEGNSNPLPMQNNLPGFGTQITGVFTTQAAAAAAGFDSTSVQAGMLTWNGTNWSNVTNTNTAIANNKAYFLYIRGDRSRGVTGSANNASATTLRTNGTVYTGDQVNTIGANSFSLVPNVYASPIDFTGLTRTGGVSNLFYIWDSKKQNGNSLGVYQTFSGTNGFNCLISGGSYVLGQPNTAIESGQAFFVQSAAAGTITLKETSKSSSGNGHLGMRPSTPSSALVKIDSRLYATGANMLDANVVVFDPAYSNAVDGDDAVKFSNPGENLGIQKGNTILAIEGRQPAGDNDAIQFKMWNMQPITYTLEFVASNMGNQGVSAALEDSYLNSSTPLDLNGTTTVNFTVNNVAASSAANRFRIVFRQLAPVPVNFVSVKGYRTNNAVKVDWKSASERGIKNYVIERSTDGRTFAAIGNTAPASNNAIEINYSFDDATAPSTALMYRIKSEGVNGEIRYSPVAKVNALNVKPGFVVSPNPVENSVMNLQFEAQQAGRYSVRLISNDGKTIMMKNLTHAGGSAVQTIELPGSAIRGSYSLEITAPDNSKTVQTVFVNNK